METFYYLHRPKSRCQSLVGGGEQPNKVQPILLGNEENQVEYFPALIALLVQDATGIKNTDLLQMPAKYFIL